MARFKSEGQNNRKVTLAFGNLCFNHDDVNTISRRKESSFSKLESFFLLSVKFCAGRSCGQKVMKMLLQLCVLGLLLDVCL